MIVESRKDFEIWMAAAVAEQNRTSLNTDDQQ